MSDWTLSEMADLAATADRRLNVGSGRYPLRYFTNLDMDESMPAQVHATVPPLPFEDNHFDAIWACHFLEHLEHDKAQEFMAECYRVLTPSGTLGLVVPDTRLIMRRYLDEAPDCVEYPNADDWRPVHDLNVVCDLFIYSTAQDSPHRWMYDEYTLAEMFVRAGFVGLCDVDRYRDPRLGSAQWFQFGIEAHKPTAEEVELQEQGYLIGAGVTMPAMA